MKVVVSMDGDGHFDVSKLSDREGTIKVLQSAQDGEYYDMIVDDLEEIHYAILNQDVSASDETWENVIRQFVQRGTIEIVEI